MKPDEAMEILKLNKTCDFEGNSKDLEDAHQLGYEAIKAILQSREGQPRSHYHLLPGETEE